MLKYYGMTEFIIGPFIIWLPIVFLWSVFAVSFFLYAAQNFLERKKKMIPPIFSKIFRLLPLILISSYVFYASIKTFAQYYVWSHNSLSKLFLPPYQGLSYFLFYSFGRFWLNAILAVGAAFVFYLFLKTLSRYRQGLFKDGEKEIGLISALLSGWPGVIVFIPLVFIITAVLAIIRLTVFKLRTTTLGLPFLLSAAIILLWGSELVSSLNLSVLKI